MILKDLKLEDQLHIYGKRKVFKILNNLFIEFNEKFRIKIKELEGISGIDKKNRIDDLDGKNKRKRKEKNELENEIKDNWEYNREFN